MAVDTRFKKVKAETCYVVYRGSLERSRLAFILESIFAQYKRVVFLWIYPGPLTPFVQSVYEDFIKNYAFVDKQILNHKLIDFFKTRNAIKSSLRSDEYDVAFVGDTASLFANCFSPVRCLWFINGIPEEGAMHNRAKGFLQSNFQWWTYTKAIKPDLIVTVSTRMSSYVTRHFPSVSIVAVPTCVDNSTFLYQGSPLDKKTGIFTYLGTGAPWQALDKLSLLWRAIHQLNKNIRFRVISRDPRCQLLAEGIDPSSIEFLQSSNFKEVASFLHGAEAGFLIRNDSIVNRVSFPTKLAEYLASGCWVVASELDWDITDYLNKYKAGFLAPDISIEKLAENILNYRETIDWPNQQKGIQACAAVLDRKYWLLELDKMLT